MNFEVKMLPGLILLLAGFLLTVLAPRLVQAEKVNRLKLAGTAVAALGAVLVFAV